jgi:hypothetical protein
MSATLPLTPMDIAMQQTAPARPRDGSLGSAAVVGFFSALALLALWFAHQGNLLCLGFPALAALIALILIVQKPVAYLRFTLWIWFLTPFLRRIVDFRCGWEEPNLLLLAPLLVSAVSGYTLLRPRAHTSVNIAPFVLCGAAVAYGLIVGLFLKPSMEVVYGLFNWATPILLGLHISKHWDDYDRHRDAILSTFCWGTLVLGSYGLYQFFTAPDWDVFWLQNITSGLIDPSFGTPEPMGLRVWSTMNSAGPFANMLIVGLLMLIIAKQPGKLLFNSVGTLALLVTFVRTAWLSWLIGLAFLLKGVKPRVMLKGLTSLLVMAVLIVPLAGTSLAGPMLQDRFKTFKNIGHDESFQERSDMYRIMTERAEGDPFGHGLRNQEIIGNLVIDSGILTMLFSLGWAGTLFYLCGLFWLMFHRTQPAAADPFAWTCKVVCIAFLAQLIGSNLFVGSTGTFFWVMAGMTVAAERWHRNNALLESARGPLFPEAAALLETP